MLSIFDCLFLLCMTFSFSLPPLFPIWGKNINPLIFPWIRPILQISLSGSIWSTVAVACERYFSVAYPLQIVR